MCYFVVEDGTFFRRVLVCICDSSLIPETHGIEAWVELMEDYVMPDPGKTAVFEVELEYYRAWFASFAEFDACVGNGFLFLKIIGVEVLAVQGLSSCIDRSFESLVPRMFVRGSPKVFVAPPVRSCSHFRTNGWISAESEEIVPLQFLIFNFARRGNDVDINLLEMECMVRPWLTRDGLLVELSVLMNLLFTTYQNASQLPFVTLGADRSRKYLFADQSFLRIQVWCGRSMTILMAVWLVLLDKSWHEWAISMLLIVWSREVLCRRRQMVLHLQFIAF